MTYFISGHRDITKEEFAKYYIPQINKYIDLDKNAKFLIGNSEGCDTLAIKYLSDKSCLVMIIPFEAEIPEYGKNTVVNSKRFKTGDIRDAYLTKMSQIDIAFIRSGREDSATARNILRRFMML